MATLIRKAKSSNDGSNSDHANGYELLRTMELATSPVPLCEESAVDDFTVLSLHALGFTKRERVSRTRKVIPFVICAENRHAQMYACVVDDNGCLSGSGDYCLCARPET
ncbi:hypothetical protein EDB19DRAFT_1709680 [Suillus lakei]|nr:hypothetical protein EDB19DRAFT_1709680 [Suillus lakei]